MPSYSLRTNGNKAFTFPLKTANISFPLVTVAHRISEWYIRLSVIFLISDHDKLCYCRANRHNQRQHSILHDCNILSNPFPDSSVKSTICHVVLVHFLFSESSWRETFVALTFVVQLLRVRWIPFPIGTLTGDSSFSECNDGAVTFTKTPICNKSLVEQLNLPSSNSEADTRYLLEIYVGS